MLETKRAKGQRNKNTAGTCVMYTPESIARINAAFESGAQSTTEAISRANRGVTPQWKKRILTKKERLEFYYTAKDLRAMCYERQIPGRSKLQTKDAMVRALLCDMFLPVNVVTALQDKKRKRRTDSPYMRTRKVTHHPNQKKVSL